MKIYKLNPYADLCTTSALIQNKDRKYYAVLLIDSGSSFTLLNPDILENVHEFCHKVFTDYFCCFGNK